MKFTKKNTIINEKVENGFKPELPLEDEIKGTVDDTYANAVKVHAKKEKEIKDAMKPAEEARKDLEKMTTNRRETRKIKTKDMDALYLSEDVKEDVYYEDPGFEYGDDVSEKEYAISFAKDLGFTDGINGFPLKTEEDFKDTCIEEAIMIEDLSELYIIYKEMYNEVAESSDLDSNVVGENLDVEEAVNKLNRIVEEIAKRLLSLPDYTADDVYVDAWNDILDACAKYNLDTNTYAENAFDYLQELLEMGFEKFYLKFKDDFDDWDRWTVKKIVEDVFYPEEEIYDDEYFTDDEELEESRKLDETPKQKKEYYYNGPVYHFEKKIMDNWEATTMARSKREALNNITFRAKKALGFGRNAKLYLDQDLISEVVQAPVQEPEQSQEPEKEVPTCEKCGRRLNDAGECIICDLNDESYLEESAENKQIKILDLCTVDENDNIWYADPEEIFVYAEPHSWKGYIDRLNASNLDDLTFNLDDIDTSIFIIDDGGELFRTKDGTYYEACWRGDMCRVWEEDDDERIEYFDAKLSRNTDKTFTHRSNEDDWDDEDDFDESLKEAVYKGKYSIDCISCEMRDARWAANAIDEDLDNIEQVIGASEEIVFVKLKDGSCKKVLDYGDSSDYYDIDPEKYEKVKERVEKGEKVYDEEEFEEVSTKEAPVEEALDEEVTPEAKTDREAIEEFLGDKIIKKAISTEFDEDSKYLYNYFSVVVKEKDFDEDKLDELFDNLEYYYDYDFNTEEGKYLGDLADTERGQIEVRFKHLTAPETLDKEEEKDTLVECSKIVEEYTSEEDICRIDDELFDKAQKGQLIKKFEDGLDHYYMEPETQKVWLIKLNDDESINKIILF